MVKNEKSLSSLQYVWKYLSTCDARSLKQWSNLSQFVIIGHVVAILQNRMQGICRVAP